MEVQFSNLLPSKFFFPFLPWNSCLQRQLCVEKSVKAKISISMNFVAKCCQPPGILGDFAVDCWKFIGFTRPGILRPSPCTDKKWNSPMFHHCNVPIRFSHFEHLELPRSCIVTWHLLAANSKLQSVSWILAEFYFNRGLQRLYTGTCIILQKTINGFLCLLIVFLKGKTHQLNLKDVIKLNRNLG